MDLTSYSSDAGESSATVTCCSVNGQLKLRVKFKNGVKVKLDI